MIPQAMASTGAYADLWGNLRSMAHAFERVQHIKEIKDVAELDKARLNALVRFLKKELEPKNVEAMLSPKTFISHEALEVGYSLDIDLHDVLQELPAFKDWLKTQRLGFSDKSHRLVATLEEYVKNLDRDLIRSPFPEAEARIFQQLLVKLLSKAESSLL